jgi:RNA polymerase-binding transcription factor
MINETELKLLGETLKNMQETLLQDIRAESGKLHTYVNANPSPTDLAEKSLDQGRVTSRVSQLKRELKLVEAAIKRLDEGSYGVCSKCGGEINLERLKIIPYATYCVKCKAKLEAPRF